MSRPVELVVVVVPVRDEAERVGACLDSIALAVAHLSDGTGGTGPAGGAATVPRVRVVAVLDRCTDDSAAVVAGYPWVEACPSTVGRVGAARALGVRLALTTESVAAERIWIATTDADSRVPPEWLSHQVEQARAGADLFRGLVEPDPAECGSAAYDVWSRDYRRRDGHGHVHGANLGVRATAYAACGGFDELAAVDEDVTLWAAAQQRAFTVVASAQAPVATSGRLVGRVNGSGFAAYLRGAREMHDDSTCVIVEGDASVSCSGASCV